MWDSKVTSRKKNCIKLIANRFRGAFLPAGKQGKSFHVTVFFWSLPVSWELLLEVWGFFVVASVEARWKASIMPFLTRFCGFFFFFSFRKIVFPVNDPEKGENLFELSWFRSEVELKVFVVRLIKINLNIFFFRSRSSLAPYKFAKVTVDMQICSITLSPYQWFRKHGSPHPPKPITSGNLWRYKTPRATVLLASRDNHSNREEERGCIDLGFPNQGGFSKDFFFPFHRKPSAAREKICGRRAQIVWHHSSWEMFTALVKYFIGEKHAGLWD